MGTKAAIFRVLVATIGQFYLSKLTNLIAAFSYIAISLITNSNSSPSQIQRYLREMFVNLNKLCKKNIKPHTEFFYEIAPIKDASFLKNEEFIQLSKNS